VRSWPCHLIARASRIPSPLACNCSHMRRPLFSIVIACVSCAEPQASSVVVTMDEAIYEAAIDAALFSLWGLDTVGFAEEAPVAIAVLDVVEHSLPAGDSEHVRRWLLDTMPSIPPVLIEAYVTRVVAPRPLPNDIAAQAPVLRRPLSAFERLDPIEAPPWQGVLDRPGPVAWISLGPVFFTADGTTALVEISSHRGPLNGFRLLLSLRAWLQWLADCSTLPELGRVAGVAG
jgi:hypothetical protein